MAEVLIPAEVAAAIKAVDSVGGWSSHHIRCLFTFDDGSRCTQGPHDHLHGEPVLEYNGRSHRPRVRPSCVGRHHAYVPDMAPFYDSLADSGYQIIPTAEIPA